MKKKQFRHLGCRVKIKETLKHTDIDVVMPDNSHYGKRLIDNRPDKTVSMVDNEALDYQIRGWISDKLSENNNNTVH